MSGLKIWTRCLAICARRSRRISSSLLPLNMLPVMTSIQPCCGVFRTTSMSDSRLIFPGLGVDADLVALIDEGWHRHDQPGLERRRLDLRARGCPLDARDRFLDDEIHGRGELDA